MRTSKFTIAMLTALFMVLTACVAFATWIIISPPQNVDTRFVAETPKKAVYVKKIVETTPAETVMGSYLSNKVEFSFEDGTDASSAIQSFGLGTANSGGAVPEVDLKTDAQIKVGCTYSVSVLDITFDSTLYSLAGTYQNKTEDSLVGKEESSNINIILKHKTVDVGGTLYTIEDALAQNGNATVKADTSFAGKDVANLAGYSGDDYYTVKEGVTLLLPYADVNEGTDTNEMDNNETYQSGITPSDYKNAKRYLTLTVAQGITLSNQGTITVGAITGAANTGITQGDISGGYAEMALGANSVIQNEGAINAFGNIYGSGKISSKNNSKVRERLKIKDWRGGTIAASVFLPHGTQISAFSLLGSDYEPQSGHLFPFKQYEANAITADLEFEYGATWSGIVRIWTNDVEDPIFGSTAVPAQFTTVDFVLASKVGDKQGLFQLQSNSTLLKQSASGRTKITVSGGAVGGQANLEVSAGANFILKSGIVAFPIDGTIDIELQDGVYSSEYGYRLLPGATLKVCKGPKNIASKLSLTNSDKGYLIYCESDIVYADNSNPASATIGKWEYYPKGRGDSQFIVGTGCSLEISGKFGGEIIGEDAATLNIASDSTLTNRIEEGWGEKARGGGLSTTYTFTFNATTTKDINATGTIYGSTDGQFASGKTYIYHNGAWISTDTQFTINYNYVFKDIEGDTPDNIGNGNLTQHSYNDGTIELIPATCQGWTFMGWFTDASCEHSIDRISNTMLEEITLYGLFQQVDAYVITYNLGYPDGYSLPDGKQPLSTIPPETVVAENISAYNPDTYNNIVQVYDDDSAVQYYFGGWYVDSGFTTEFSVENLGEAHGSTPVTIYAKWLKKATVKFVDNTNVNEWEQSGYYKLEDTVKPTGHNPAGYDYDVTVSTYFSGTWEMTGGNDTLFDESTGSYTVAANGENVTITAQRAKKATLSVDVSGKSTLKLQVLNTIQWSSLTKVLSGTYYLLPGTEVNYEISSTAKNGSGIDATNATWSWSISGAAAGDDGVSNGSGPMSPVSNKFTMPASDKTVVIEADSADGTCIVEGTLITMADGTQKPIEEVKAGDDILVFNHETGKYEAGKMWFVDDATQPKEWHTIIRLTFSDGSSIGVSYRHGFFDLDLNKYVYIDEASYGEYIGHRFTNVKQVNGEFVSGEVTLISVSVAEEYVRVFGPMSEYHFNMVTDGLLSMPAFNYGEQGFVNFFEFGEGMKYDEAKMQADIEKYGLFTYEEFADLITYDIWCKAPVQYLKISIAKGLMTFEDIELTVQWLIDKGFFE